MHNMPDEPTLRQLYEVKRLSLAKIAKIYGVSRVYMWKWAKRYGIKSHHGNFVVLTCPRCGKETTLRWGKAQQRNGEYCSIECYHLHRLEISHYLGAWRHGQRIAHQVMGAGPGQVVHHIDGNCSNNNPTNLMVFNSNAEHLAYHHAKRISTIHALNSESSGSIGSN